MSLSQFFNQNSFLLSALVAVAFVSLLVFRRGLRSVGPFSLGLLVAVIAGLLAVWIGLRADSTFEGQADLERALASRGQPVMLEVFSNR